MNSQTQSKYSFILQKDKGIYIVDDGPFEYWRSIDETYNLPCGCIGLDHGSLILVRRNHADHATVTEAAS